MHVHLSRCLVLYSKQYCRRQFWFLGLKTCKMNVFKKFYLTFYCIIKAAFRQYHFTHIRLITVPQTIAMFSISTLSPMERTNVYLIWIVKIFLEQKLVSYRKVCRILWHFGLWQPIRNSDFYCYNFVHFVFIKSFLFRGSELGGRVCGRGRLRQVPCLLLVQPFLWKLQPLCRRVH